MGLLHLEFGWTLVDLAAFATAESDLREAVALLEVVGGERNFDAAKAHWRLGQISLETGRLAESDRELRLALARLREWQHDDDMLVIGVYDADKAEFHLKKSGLTGATLPVVTSPAAVGSLDMAHLLQLSAKQIGLTLNIKQVPGGGYWSDHWMKHPLGFGSILPRPSADLMFTMFFKSNAVWNESGWKNEKFDQLLVAARAQTDEAKRKQLYADMQVLVHEHCGIGIPLFRRHGGCVQHQHQRLRCTPAWRIHGTHGRGTGMALAMTGMAVELALAVRTSRVADARQTCARSGHGVQSLLKVVAQTWMLAESDVKTDVSVGCVIDREGGATHEQDLVAVGVLHQQINVQTFRHRAPQENAGVARLLEKHARRAQLAWNICGYQPKDIMVNIYTAVISNHFHHVQKLWARRWPFYSMLPMQTSSKQ